MVDQNNTIEFAAICGSLRTDSYNKKLMYLLQEELKAFNITLLCIELEDYELPLFNGDQVKSQSIPEAAIKLRNIVKNVQGLLLVSPEYCGSVPGVLKNVIDWLSIALGSDKVYAVFENKPLAIAVATNNQFGGIKCAEHWRCIAGSMRAIALPHMLVVREAQSIDQVKMQHIKKFVEDLATFVHRWYDK